MKEETQLEITYNSADEVSTALAEAATRQRQLSEQWHSLYGDLDKVPTLDLTPEKRSKVSDEIVRQIKTVEDQWWSHDGQRGWHQWAISSAIGFSDLFPSITAEEKARLKAEYKTYAATIPPCTYASVGRA
jgi:hypothetical protein